MNIPSLGTLDHGHPFPGHPHLCSPLVPQWLCHHCKGTIPVTPPKSSNFFPVFYFLSHPDSVSPEGTPVLHSAVPYPALAGKRATF